MRSAFGLTKKELATLQRLSTPVKIQDFLDDIPFNFEEKGETHMSPRRVLRMNRASCIEGALLATLTLWLHGEKPLLMDLRAHTNDDDHVVALYKRNGHWGLVSKTNHATIRFRDPVYKTLRELALSYFHEWFLNTTGEKTLESYSDPLDLSKLGTAWVTDEADLWWLDKKLDALPHHSLVPKKNRRYLRKADPMELMAGRFTEWVRGGKRTR
ncbi:hypothetical protein A3E65_00065 [Candidatus Kaiserbacteria bacterium RIFCSPHIGHO2_12_FULL_56_13]|uniref:Transglutaminase-like domain-containing protein n=2 Tax=Candidatus Kaiseribacteriota TaxID=1752734 RepID=A0A1F6E3F0_9BACT|nr:MAG: hypothetical protein A3C95_00595 [Candidatus Kaiserbacteria bacterium RIFCSPHIGHO2_02_FULL_56_30]OGG72203.1 MAG: hypothetical protein A3E65_00065 [Candidatus Kaiserbacteria bacterium RIFCSPHIGHO2_12_FULL_56_13]